MAQELQGLVWGFKVNDLLVDCGVEVVSALSHFGQVFADPKLNDIPNTVSNSVKKLVAAGANMITVHGCAGEEALRRAQDAAGASNILAITVLTSFKSEAVEGVFGRSLEDAVLNFAGMAVRSGVSGVVCSPHELHLLASKASLGSLIRVTPGVRPQWSLTEAGGLKPGDDQSRIMTPAQAISAGASLLVIGRPITGDANPRAAVERINLELGLQ
jgi:orotidine-5'-phosphate decarboxylase